MVAPPQEGSDDEDEIVETSRLLRGDDGKPLPRLMDILAASPSQPITMGGGHEEQKATSSKLMRMGGLRHIPSLGINLGYGMDPTKAPPCGQQKMVDSPPTTPSDCEVGQMTSRLASEEASKHGSNTNPRGHGRSKSISIPTQSGPEPPARERRLAGRQALTQATIALREQQRREAGRDMWQQEGGINLDEDGTVAVQPRPRKRGRLEVAAGQWEGGEEELDADQNTGPIEKARSQPGKTTMKAKEMPRRGRSLTPLSMRMASRALLVQRQSNSPTSPLALPPFLQQDEGGQTTIRHSSPKPLHDDLRKTQGEGSRKRGEGGRGWEGSEEYFAEEEWPAGDDMDIGEQSSLKFIKRV
jgi:hypothetical protein